MAALVGLSVVLSETSVATDGHRSHEITLHDLEALGQNNVYYMQLSSDGQRIVYTLWGKASAGGEPADDLWVVGTRPGSMPRQYGHGTLPQWSPNGKLLAYFANDAEGRQLWVLDVQSDHARQVTHFIGGITYDPYTRQGGWLHDPLLYSWSPDGTRLVFAAEVDRTGAAVSEDATSAKAVQSTHMQGAPLVLTNSTPTEWTMRGVYAGRDRRDSETAKPRQPQVTQLFVVNVNSQQLTQLTKDNGNYYNPDWSPDGRKIACISTEGRSLSGADLAGSQIYTVDVSSGVKTAVTAAPGMRRAPRWSPNGRWISFIHTDQRFGKQSGFAVAATGGTTADLTRKLAQPESPGEAIFRMSWSADSKSVIVNYDGISSIAVATGDTHVLVPAKGARVGLMTESIARNGNLAWEQSNETSQGVIYVLIKGANTPFVLVDVNPQMRTWTMGGQDLVYWKNSRGEELEGVLIRPAGYRPGQKYPLIVDCYPGYGKNPHAFYGDAMMGNQALASRGYAVFFPAIRAPHVWMNVVRSEAFMEEAKGSEGWNTTVDDIMSGLDELIHRGVVDPARMCLSGFSNGGGIVDYLVTATSSFKCAVSAAPVNPDWIAQFFLPSPGVAPSMVTEYAGTKKAPWDDLEGWINLSAVFRLPRVSTPILLAVGDNDLGFLPGTIEMYNGLRYLGKDVTLLRYGDQGHGFEGKAMQDFWTRKIAFFDRYLKPVVSNNRNEMDHAVAR